MTYVQEPNDSAEIVEATKSLNDMAEAFAGGKV